MCAFDVATETVRLLSNEQAKRAVHMSIALSLHSSHAVAGRKTISFPPASCAQVQLLYMEPGQLDSLARVRAERRRPACVSEPLGRHMQARLLTRGTLGGGVFHMNSNPLRNPL